eukprot:6590984-Pyramimonas_sp.AAC.1
MLTPTPTPTPLVRLESFLGLEGLKGTQEDPHTNCESLLLNETDACTCRFWQTPMAAPAAAKQSAHVLPVTTLRGA